MVNKLKNQATVVEGPLVLVRRRFQRPVSSPSRAEDGAVAPVCRRGCRSDLDSYPVGLPCRHSGVNVC